MLSDEITMRLDDVKPRTGMKNTPPTHKYLPTPRPSADEAGHVLPGSLRRGRPEPGRGSVLGTYQHFYITGAAAPPPSSGAHVGSQLQLLRLIFDVQNGCDTLRSATAAERLQKRGWGVFGFKRDRRRVKLFPLQLPHRTEI